jgi:hypothetical protein
MDLLLEVDQRVKLSVHLQDDVAPAPAIPASGTSPGHVFLAPKGDDSVSAVAGFHVDFGFVK